MVARVLIISLVAVLAAALVGCKKQSELYCELHPGDLENCGYLDAGIDARPTCTVDQDCATSTGAPYCEPTAQFCVECYLPEHCATNAVETFCDPQSFLCTSCVENTDCASNVCLPNGVCGDDSNVAYVDPVAGVDNANCTSTSKCKTVAAALATKKPNIKLEGTISEPVEIKARAVTLIGGPNTVLTRASNGVVLVVTDGSDVAIYDLQIIGAAEKGINADMNSTLRLTRVSVTGCNAKDKRAIEVKNSTLIMTRSAVFANVGGGVLVDAMSIYQITNSMFYRNGKSDSAVGGLVLAPTSSTFNRFELNTVADNIARVAVPGGVQCAASIAAPNNLVVRNTSDIITLGTTQVGGNCNFDQSTTDADATNYMFISAETAPFDYHVNPGSMAIDRGVTTDITADFDGEPRPFNMKIDVGADEYSP
jgi:hypothetical protein